jgi:hypothetical protein
MADVKQFKLRNNRIRFQLDEEQFTVNYPKEYQFGREYLDAAKEVPLALWANKVAFQKPDSAYLDFEISDMRVQFWLWVAQKVHELDHYQSLSDEFDSEEIEYQNLRKMVDVEVGSDTGSLLSTLNLPDKQYEGALISQSTGKESIATKLLLDEVGVDTQKSVFIEYSSRAATHKIDTRHEFREYFNEEPIRLWSNFNELQSTLQEYTENYEPITCFWELFYVAAELPLAIKHGLEYILVGSQLNTGEAMAHSEGRYTTFEELNQSYIFELAYTDYISETMGLPIVHTSPIRPFTGYSCRKIIAEREPEFLEIMHNCLRPNSKNRWCKKCYKCADAWVEFMGCGFNPADAGLDHDVLIENPHLGAIDTSDWGFVFARPDRNEQIWIDDGAKEFFKSEVKPTLTEEQTQAFQRWRSRQNERVDQEDIEHLRKFNGKFVEPVSGVVPDTLTADMGLPHGQFVEDALDVREYRQFSQEWK